MIVSRIQQRLHGGIVRAEAQVAWEDAALAPMWLYADTEARFGDWFWADPNAFLLAALMRAWEDQEQRLRIDARICPVLLDNLRIAVAVLESWFPAELPPGPRIEPGTLGPARAPRHEASLSLLSCGIDSLATLRCNRLQLPADHPSAIRAGVMVARDNDTDFSEEGFRRCVQGRCTAAAPVAEELGIELLPVRTNFWRPGNDGYFFSFGSHGAIFCAAASLFSRGFHKTYIASSYEARSLRPWGSHPLLDPHYSSAHFEVAHHGMHMSRTQKIALVADWPAGLNSIRVCQNDDSGAGNCGTCRKCIKTMTVLLALGKLADCRAFPRQDVDADLLLSMATYDMIDDADQVDWCRAFVPRLRERHRDDLSDALQQIVDAYSGKAFTTPPLIHRYLRPDRTLRTRGSARGGDEA